MNTIANNVASKLFVAFVATAMLFTLATPAKAATVEELQAQVAALMAQISAMTGGSTTGGSMSSAACTFTRALTVGSQGEDVKCLQSYLTPTYFKNAGGATGYFGPVTASAVAAWQSANGVAPAAGYFGPVSQAKYKELMAAAPSTGDDDDDDTSSDDDDDDSSEDLSGEASLDSVEVSDGEDADEVEEGSEDAQVAEIEVTFEDGDAIINRIDLALEVDSNNNGDDDPWEVFQDVSLWVDGDEVARMDASDEDEYLDEDDGSLRFSGLDILARDGEDVTIVVAVTVNNTVDGVGSSDDEGWNVGIGSLRFTDADDVTTTETSVGDMIDITDNAIAGNAKVAEFDIEVEGAGDSLDLESSDEDPDGDTIGLDEDNNTEALIFAFDLSAEDSDGDVDLNEIIVAVQVGGAGTSVDTLVNDFRLEIGGDSYDAESYTGTGSSTLLTFDIDGDTTVPADEVVTAMLYADFENMDNSALEGSTIYATTSSSSIDAEGSDDIDVGGSTVTGETHTLRTEGMSVTVVDDTITEYENADTTNTDDSVRFVLEFEVSAFGDNLFIPFGPTTTSGMTDGVKYRIIDSSNNVITTGGGNGTSTASLDVEDGAAEEDNSYKITDDGETLVLTVDFDPAAAGSYRIEVTAINFATSDVATATQTQSLTDLDIRTGLVTIQQ